MNLQPAIRVMLPMRQSPETAPPFNSKSESGYNYRAVSDNNKTFTFDRLRLVSFHFAQVRSPFQFQALISVSVFGQVSFGPVS